MPTEENVSVCEHSIDEERKTNLESVGGQSGRRLVILGEVLGRRGCLHLSARVRSGRTRKYVSATELCAWVSVVLSLPE